MNKRYLLWAALVIAAVIAVRPMFWLGFISFAGLMVVLVVFVGLVVIYLLSLKKGSIYREVGFGVLIIVTVCAAILLKFSAPELSASEVKEMFSYSPQGQRLSTYYISGMKALATEYKGGGVWKVKIVNLDNTSNRTVEGNIHYLYYDENTRQISTK